MLKTLIDQLSRGVDLSDEQVSVAVDQLVQETFTAEVKADFLAALARKGETVNEIAVFANELRKKSVSPPIDPETRAGEILDVCGTGGDHLHTFNISTTVAIIAAAAGVTVAKHGNRAITSKAGSADVLEALGIPIDLSPDQAAQSMRRRRFAFFFAPYYHPAFKHIGPARRLCAERGQRTIFNFLGPLLNPARPTAQLIGVPKPDLCEPLAKVLQAIGIRRGMVVSGEAGAAHMDELSTLGNNMIAEFCQPHGFTCSTVSFDALPLQPAKLSDLAGGDPSTNAEVVRRILRGQERGPKRDAVLLNAGAALFVAGKSKSILEGWELAAELIDSRTAEAKLEELVKARFT